jgi:hypothetical protein
MIVPVLSTVRILAFYNTDMVEAYLDIYPDIEEELMYDKELRYFSRPRRSGLVVKSTS